MRIDADLLQVDDAHYTKPSMVNMVEVSEDFGKKVNMVEVAEDFNQEVTKGFTNETTEGFVQQVTEDYNRGVTEDPRQMFPTEIAEGFNKEVIEDLNKETVVSFTTNETTEGFIHINMTESTEGIRVKLQELCIAKNVNMGVNMVELTQKAVVMEVDEESLRHEEYNKMSYPKQEEDLVEFLHRFQRKRPKVMLCPR